MTYMLRVNSVRGPGKIVKVAGNRLASGENGSVGHVQS